MKKSSFVIAFIAGVICLCIREFTGASFWIVIPIVFTLAWAFDFRKDIKEIIDDRRENKAFRDKNQ